MAKKFLNERQVSEQTGFSVSTLQKNRFNSKGIPYHKVNRRVLYLEKDVMDYMEKHRIEPELSNKTSI